MFWYRQYIFIASLLRRISFISKSLCNNVKTLQIQPLALAVIIFAVSCREPFAPNLRPEQTNYLVVEGFINAEGSTTITLSRTTLLKDTASIQPEQGAAITIMGEDNSTISLFENTGGHYQSDSVAINQNQKYRILIHTAEGKDYLSEYVAVKKTPPIDSVSWQNQNDGVHIFLNSHDPQNNTLYYKWDYVETWEIDSHYDANFKYFRGDAPDGSGSYIAPRDMEEIIKLRTCWRNVSSTNIHIGSTTNLSSDIISLEPVVQVPHGSEELSVRYSILVKQYALDRPAFEFYQLMKRNSESIGSLFDAQPSDLTGNIHCTSNPKEKVIGYIGVSTEQRNRIFITNKHVGDAEWGYHQYCETQIVPSAPDSLNKYLGGGSYIPFLKIGRGEAYNAVTYNCADCTARAGSVKPDFW